MKRIQIGFLLSSILFTGCASLTTNKEAADPLLVSKRLAVATLPCGDSKIKAQYAGKGLRSAIIRVVAEGCGKSQIFNCYNTAFFATEYTCSVAGTPKNDAELFVLGSASSDLRCIDKKISVVRVGGARSYLNPIGDKQVYNPDGSTFVAKGCGKSQKYHCKDIAPWYQQAKYRCEKTR